MSAAPSPAVAAYRRFCRRSLLVGGLLSLLAVLALARFLSGEAALAWGIGAAGGILALALLARQTEALRLAAAPNRGAAKKAALLRYGVRGAALAAAALAAPGALGFAAAGLFLPQIVLPFLGWSASRGEETEGAA